MHLWYTQSVTCPERYTQGVTCPERYTRGVRGVPGIPGVRGIWWASSQASSLLPVSLLGRVLSLLPFRFTVGQSSLPCAEVLSVSGFLAIPACFPFHCWALLTPVSLLGTANTRFTVGLLPVPGRLILSLCNIPDSWDVRMVLGLIFPKV